MAFHLGCLRALHDRKILGKVKVISTVSGGSVIGACWAYRGEDFAAFDRHVVSVLRRGLQWDILREAFFSWEAPKILATLFLTGTLSLILSLFSLVASRARRWLGIPDRRLEDWLAAVARHLPVWGSLTTAFEAALARRLFGEQDDRSGPAGRADHHRERLRPEDRNGIPLRIGDIRRMEIWQRHWQASNRCQGRRRLRGLPDLVAALGRNLRFREGRVRKLVIRCR